jgi:tetratricopeptide (TPR) repeat protein
MKKNWASHFILIIGRGLVVGLFWLIFAGGATAQSSTEKLDLENMSANEIVQRALTDSLYYQFDQWFEVFDTAIGRLEDSPKSLENRIELMKYNFYYSGLLGELCHTLAFTSRYKIEEIADRFIKYSNRTKELAEEILDTPEATLSQQAQANLYLGGAEGYIGIFEYGEGHLFKALINGFQADTHLEKALALDPNQIDAHFGLGIYRYGNSRLGGFGNFIMQGGRDLRQVGLDHIERAIREQAPSKPLALKTLAWFYISEQFNPNNSGIPAGKPLSSSLSRSKALEFMEEMEREYFSHPPYANFIGNKELAMMQALQFILDGDYTSAKAKFEKVLEVAEDLKNNRGFAINTQLTDSVKAGIQFCDLMLMAPEKNDEAGHRSACLKVNDQLNFLKSGGAMVEYDSKKIRGELHGVFAGKLDGLSRDMNC